MRQLPVGRLRGADDRLAFPQRRDGHAGRGVVRICGHDLVHALPVGAEDQQGAGVVVPWPRHEQPPVGMELDQPLAVRRPCRESSFVVVEHKLKNKHVSTVETRQRPALYQVILPVVAQDLDALAAVPLFAPLDHDRLARLAAASMVRTVDAGSVVATRGRQSTHLIVIEAGALTAAHETVHGQRLRLGEFVAPCAVDKAAVLDGLGYTATWQASTRSRIRLVPSDQLLAILEEVPAVRRHAFAHLSQRLRDQQDDLVLTSFADAATRTAAWLVRAAGRTGRRIVLTGAQQGLAEAIGMSRVSVNRALRTLVQEGLVRVEPGAVVLLAPELLALRASQDERPTS